ncbi:Molybdopterin converting factor, small subunit [Natronincola ferrireducens]|uniref:Molybdopterin converting factor, small subunit n=2 Tax=Natronincola ferrireducens TaxID=393762 RepID=A0A1G9F7U6_9FIRM|nr:Molybdopterin converting factor, small subunit [Natronincola ferrireducens]
MMKVKVKLFATLRENREKEMMMDLQQGATPKDIIKRLNISQEEVAIIFLNGRSVKVDKALEENDTVSIFPPVGGG